MVHAFKLARSRSCNVLKLPLQPLLDIQRETGMKALSLIQPWASLVICGAKKIETRSWQTKYRGKLAIHASKSTKYVDLRDEEPFLTALRDETLHFGCVLGFAELWNVKEITETNLPREPERSFGDYEFGRYAWFLRNVVRLPEPIPAKGQSPRASLRKRLRQQTGSPGPSPLLSPGVEWLWRCRPSS